ncbi:MAG: sugar phosphate isomerase/epimerase family protein [bacterium]
MLSLSTAWKSADIATGFELLKSIYDSGFSAIELDYRITESMYQEIRPSLKRKDLLVTSIHNYFPFADDLNKTEASADRYLLSSLDREERELGIKLTRKTIQIANDLEAKAVILHLGKVEMMDEENVIVEFFEHKESTTEEAQQFIKLKESERNSKNLKHLDAVLFSLEKLNKESERQDILLGLENRYHYYEIPSIAEFKTIFKNFEGSNLRYWHDTGHAQVNEHLGIQNHEDYLKAFADKLIGLHLHDVVDLEDHLAPGTGAVNFEMIGNYLEENVIKVIEVHSNVTIEELFKSHAFLITKGF